MNTYWNASKTGIGIFWKLIMPSSWDSLFSIWPGVPLSYIMLASDMPRFMAPRPSNVLNLYTVFNFQTLNRVTCSDPPPKRI